MELVVKGFHWETCLVYLDDIIVHSSSMEHLHWIEEVLARLRKAGLKLKPSNCHLMQKSVLYFGHVISGNGVKTDPDKTKCIRDWTTPKNLEEMRKFLGSASYHRKVIKNFEHIAAALTQLTQNIKVWSGQQHAERPLPL